MTLSSAERGRLGGLKAQASRTPEQNREHGRRVILAQYVTAVVDRAPELTPAQLARLRTVLGSAKVDASNGGRAA